jgi:alkylhydroperoxidase family enzyme
MVAAVLEDHRTAPIDDRHKALFTFIEKMNRASTTIGEADIATLKQSGWSEEAIFDAITVCALFAFYNKWIDATGVQDMPAEGYAMSGMRLAQAGYVMRAPGDK